MPKPALTPRSRDFDDFLYAVIREEVGGASLTVLSVLARHDVDPWEAARRLARLPRQAALAQIRLLIAARRQDPLTPHDDAFAVALVTKLPRASITRWPATLLARRSISGVRAQIKAFLESVSRIGSSQRRGERPDKNEDP